MLGLTYHVEQKGRGVVELGDQLSNITSIVSRGRVPSSPDAGEQPIGQIEVAALKETQNRTLLSSYKPTCKARKISVNGDKRIMKPQTIMDEL